MASADADCPCDRQSVNAGKCALPEGEESADSEARSSAAVQSSPKRRNIPSSSSGLENSGQVGDAGGYMPRTPEPRSPVNNVPAPTTPLKPAAHSCYVETFASQFAYKKLSGPSRFTLEFDNIESFKLWLATGTSRSYLGRRTSCDASPGWGIIQELEIAKPQIFLASCIGSVRWVHWGDGSVKVDTMSDSNPTVSASLDISSEQDACIQARIRRRHLKVRLCALLVLRSLCDKYAVPKDSANLVLRYLLPRAFCFDHSLSVGESSLSS